VSVFSGRWRKKPLYTVSCNAKAMIHGYLQGGAGQRASLLVYEFKFNAYNEARIKKADILFEFKSQAKPLSVTAVWPHGVHKMEKTTEHRSSKESFSLQAGPNVPFIDAGVAKTWDDVVAMIVHHHTVVKGDNPQTDVGGLFNQARFNLFENKSQKTGIPPIFTVCILLERDDDSNFECYPFITAEADLRTKVMTLFTTREADDPIVFDVRKEPFNRLPESIVVNRNNLGSTDLNKLWGCTIHTEYNRGAVEQVRYGNI
jgi:hypothetical protein